MMVEVTKRPDRRSPLHAVYRRLASIALFPVSDPISELASVHVQILHPHQRLHL